MNNYHNAFGNSEEGAQTFVSDAASLSNVFESPERPMLFDVAKDDQAAPLSHSDSFSFELEFRDPAEEACPSLRFASPKAVRALTELHTAETLKEQSQTRKRLVSSQAFTKTSFGSMSRLPEIDDEYIKKESNSRFAIQALDRPNQPLIEIKPAKTRKLRKRRFDGCSCKNSNCLRLHCACFKELGYCKPTCKCDNCLNKTEFVKTRNFAIEKTKFIFSNAFAGHEPVLVTDVTGEAHSINPRGCNCKSGCARNYCDCRKVNGKCSYICKCSDCANEKVELSREELIKIYKPSSRKKHKLVINYNKDTAGGRPNIIEFQTYQNLK